MSLEVKHWMDPRIIPFGWGLYREQEEVIVVEAREEGGGEGDAGEGGREGEGGEGGAGGMRLQGGDEVVVISPPCVVGGLSLTA
jgi:hypothetical protein